MDNKSDRRMFLFLGQLAKTEKFTLETRSSLIDTGEQLPLGVKNLFAYSADPLPDKRDLKRFTETPISLHIAK
jgi:hypothetical protein